jgi:hypothetical protein
VLRPTEPGGGVILAIDFGPRTGQRGFSRLADRLSVAEGIYETVPPRIGADLPLDTNPERYVGHWVTSVREEGAPVTAILAFCAGARFAPAMARALFRATSAPPVVLIDPSTVDNASLHAEFVAAVTALDAHLEAQETADARGRADALLSTTDLMGTAEGLRAEYQRVVELASSRAGLPAHLVDMLCGRFANYLGYLVAAGRSGDGDDFRPMVLASSDHPLPPAYRDVASRLGVLHDDLLGDPETARRVHAAVNGQGLVPLSSGPVRRSQ